LSHSLSSLNRLLSCHKLPPVQFTTLNFHLTQTFSALPGAVNGIAGSSLSFPNSLGIGLGRVLDSQRKAISPFMTLTAHQRHLPAARRMTSGRTKVKMRASGRIAPRYFAS